MAARRSPIRACAIPKSGVCPPIVMSPVLENILVNVGYYAATLVIAPGIVLAGEDRFGLARHSSNALRAASVVLALIGAGLQLWAIVVLHRMGRGTPSPLSPTSQLVTAGPYAFVRNPLNLGEMMVFLGLSAWLGSVALFAYAVLAWVAFHIFVIRQEEPRHAKLFGDKYLRYRRSVGRWLPKLR